MQTASILWRRLDAAGHDACRLRETDGGWRLEGMAVFAHEGAPACLAYAVRCDREWRTREGEVQGWAGGRHINHRIERTVDDVWKLNGEAARGLEGCVDLDLGFTPATNLLQLRRAALRVGEAADIPVAWLDLPGSALDRLDQHYERRSIELYWYDAPRFRYSGLLQVSAAGFVERYPQLWDAVS